MNILVMVIFLIIGVIIGYLLRYLYAKRSFASIEMQAKKILEEAKKLSEEEIKKAKQEARYIIEKERAELERSNREHRQELLAWERKIRAKEEAIDRKYEIIDKRTKELYEKENKIKQEYLKLEEEKKLLLQQQEKQRQILERISGLSQEEAKKILLQSLEEDVKNEFAVKLKKYEEEFKETVDKKAKEILVTAMQRIASEVAIDNTTTIISIPDDLKGRIIGREGRNIRVFEQLTGVDVIVDDTPETLVISSFDPVRREIAKIAMERLIQDSRIHPARVEEIVNKTKAEFEEHVKKIGEDLAMEVGVFGLDPYILKLLGKLKFRTSYGQNQLQHTKEVALIAGAIAGELGADINFCKRAGLLHDIGKAVSHEVEGAHHQISADIARKYGESEKMINAILSHHEGIVEPKSLEAFILAAADAISASRPGARQDTVEHYVKRIEKIEQIAKSFKGVENAYAIYAGRELRVLVDAEKINDSQISILARDISKKIEEEVDYPGQIKVVVIREVRVEDYAR
ncbi:MAG: ribonuclease Y [Elusimicrobiota bacterium]|nr:ribonuclease Y [Endomicrobiia bacterium]MDW8164906.1 ribonuclease Y [Elusimicrobiota bacterium]